MPFISYAPNSEDVMLWRVFRDVRDGFYVDIGAAHPDEGSATRALYDRGWRGITIAAAPSMERLADARPRDVTLAGPVEDLASVLEAHAPGTIHFLRVAESGALEDFDFRAHRPVVVVCVDGGLTPTLPDASAGYRFAFFDGVNRFYVADEWFAGLSRHFEAPVNVLDDYVRVADAPWARTATALEARVAQAEERAVSAEEGARAAYARAFEQAQDLGISREKAAEADRMQARAEALWQAADAWGHACNARTAAAEAQAAAAVQRAEAAEAQAAALAQDLSAARLLLDATYRSTSWRVTVPLRAVSSLLQPPNRVPAAPSRDIVPLAIPVAAVEPVPEAPAEPEPSVIALPPAPAVTPARPGLLRAVHQFHSGSSTGDAITNNMLLIQAQLRRLGYRSEIFVEHRDPALADMLHLVADRPRGADHVLIVHHSMGSDVLPEILAEPAPKILYYHNITPAEFLPPVPQLLAQAELGRTQLVSLRDMVVAAVADSEFNALGLRRLGFGHVRSCALLVDLDALRQRAWTPGNRPEGQPFTVLFVGRVINSKAQADLVDAFAAFRTALGRPARLMLVGKIDALGPYLGAIGDRIRAHGLEAEVVLTGPVTDAELHAQYAAADLYVSLSHHEGFGVPLVEAVAYGVPVLAWPSGAVPYTLGDPAGLLADRDPDAVAARMLAVARDPGARDSLVAGQRAALDRFALARQWPVLQEALGRAGAIAPPDPAEREALAGQLGFAITGHAQGSYSLAAVNRGLAEAIEAERPGRVRLTPVEGQPTTDLSVLPPAARMLAERAPSETGPEVIVSQHYPIHVPDRGDLTLALVFWEESLLPDAMIETLAQGFDAVLAPSAFVAKALTDSGLALPVRVIGQGPDLSAFEAVARQRKAPEAGSVFTFLHVSSCFPRKGVDVLLAAYVRAFRRGDSVRLVIKGFPNPHNTVPADVAALLAADPDAPSITVIDEDLGTAAMLDLYRQADAMVLPTRGEGLNLPAAEAMAAGVPLIVTGSGGHMDFCDSLTARLVRYWLAPAATHLASAHSLWAEPDESDLVAALYAVESARRDQAVAAALAERTGRARVQVARVLNRRALVRRLEVTSLDLLLQAPPAPLRVAWVTSWAVRCGVAEYSRHLIDALPPHPGILEHLVLADDRTEAAGTTPRARAAWRLGDPGSVAPLASAITAEDPDIVVIQHQPGLMPWPGLVAWLVLPVLTGRVVVVTLHNTRNLAEADAAVRLAAVAALGGVARVMVHTLADMDRLRAMGLAANVTLMPHGVRAAPVTRAVQAGGEAPLIGCYGFFLPGKGIGELIEALGVLRRTVPGARLRLVNADYGVDLSTMEIARCRALARDAGLDEAIDWETRFLPDAESLALLSACDLIVIPTQASNEASSAAVRTALAAGPPVMVTPLPLFDDVGGAVTRCAGVTPDDLAAGISSLLADPQAAAAVQEAAGVWRHDHAWPLVARRFQGMLLGLSASRDRVTMEF